MWGIWYELSKDETAYLNKVTSIQGNSRDLFYSQGRDYDEYIATIYPQPTDKYLYSSASFLDDSDRYEKEAKKLSVPVGCRVHYKIWLESIKDSSWFIYESELAMLGGEGSRPSDATLTFATYAKIARKETNEGFGNADRLLGRIKRRGCGEG